MSESETPANDSKSASASQFAKWGGAAALVAGSLYAILLVAVLVTFSSAGFHVLDLFVILLAMAGYVASGVLALRGHLGVAPWFAIPATLLSALGSLASLDMLGDSAGDFLALLVYGSSAILGVVAVVFLLIAFTKRPRPVGSVTPPTTRKCPYCAEQIKAEAQVCKHCGRDIKPSVLPDA